MKKIFILCTYLMFVICLVGCRKNKYNARIISEGYVFNENFLLDNKTYGTDLNMDENYPKERVIIVNNESYFQKVFNSFPDIDFDKEMILLHGFTTSSNSSYVIKSINLEDERLRIEYSNTKTSKKTPPNASNPDTKWFIVKLDYIDICSVEFEFVK